MRYLDKLSDLLLIELFRYEIWIQRNGLQLFKIQRCALEPGHLFQYSLLQLGHMRRENVVACIGLQTSKMPF